MKGWFMEDFAPGDHWGIGSHHFTREAILSFNRRFDPIGFHVDDAAAANSPYGRITAAGLHTACGWMVCYLRHNHAVQAELARQGLPGPGLGPSPGFRNMKWPKPVYAGDTVTYSGTVKSVRAMKSRPGWGLMSGLHQGHNQHGELVFAYEGLVLVQARTV